MRIALQAARGLQAAHAQGLVHRDVKPANLLLEDGLARVKITDFGLARSVNDAELTREGVVTGTPAYMAPEQARGEPVDHRCDLFSLGGVLCAMCAGRPPFLGDPLAVLRKVCDEAPPPLRSRNEELIAGAAWFLTRHRRSAAPVPHPEDPAESNKESDPATAMISFPCPTCGKTIRARTALAGKKAKCPQCGNPIVVPDATSIRGGDPVG